MYFSQLVFVLCACAMCALRVCFPRRYEWLWLCTVASLICTLQVVKLQAEQVAGLFVDCTSGSLPPRVVCVHWLWSAMEIQIISKWYHNWSTTPSLLKRTRFRMCLMKTTIHQKPQKTTDNKIITESLRLLSHAGSMFYTIWMSPGECKHGKQHDGGSQWRDRENNNKYSPVGWGEIIIFHLFLQCNFIKTLHNGHTPLFVLLHSESCVS